MADFETDMDSVAAILDRDFSRRFADPSRHGTDPRPILSPERSLGSVIKLLTPSRRSTRRSTTPGSRASRHYVKELVFVVKRYYRPEWGDDWRSHFSVDRSTGARATS